MSPDNTTMHSNPTLQNILLLDAATCVAAGALMAFGSKFVAGLTGIPAPLLTWAGLLLFPVAALMIFAGLQAVPSRPIVWLIVLGNIGWVVASLGLFAFIAPNALGYVFILAQAGAVAILALLEHSALQRSGAALA
jgi:ABC-type xylose transport system permease subunit